MLKTSLNISRKHIRVALVALTGVALLTFAAFRFQTNGERSHASARSLASADRLARLPPVILWAWERPERLDFLDPQKTGVAFLAKTIYLRGDGIVGRPRLQPLVLPAGLGVIAVARIESTSHGRRAEQPTLSEQQRKEAAEAIAELGRLPNVMMVQVDFDATTTERAFYRALLTELRGKLPPSTLLSMTALASWCKGDNWLDDLPVDEAVPMLFRMGLERKQFLSQLAAGAEFTAKPCQRSAGISTDEPIEEMLPRERVYVFNPESWTPASVKQTIEIRATRHKKDRKSGGKPTFLTPRLRDLLEAFTLKAMAPEIAPRL